MELKDFAKEIERCSACSYCKWIPFDHVKSIRYAKNCPSIDYHNFNSYSARGRYLTSRSILRDQVELSEEVMDIAHTCLSCGACDVSCKISRYNLEPLEMTHALKAELVGRGVYPEAQERMLEHLRKELNIFGESRKNRGDWAKGLALKELSNVQAPVVFHAGCSFSYDRKLERTVRTAANILKAAGIDFGIMGDAEMCCGARIYSMGHVGMFRKLAEANIKAWHKAGVTTIITACADGYHGFKHLYPELGSSFQVYHIVEYIDLLIREGKLKFTREVPVSVTYHDPCHLGRLGEPHEPWEGKEVKFRNQIVIHSPSKPRRNGIKGIYDEPRNILQAIPGVTLREMERIREYSYCCGAGGGARESYPEYSRWVARERLEEAADTGAQVLVTACPWCRTNFSDSREAHSSLEVMDILDLVQKAL